MNGFVQVIEGCGTLKEATAMFSALSEQVGFKNGRVHFDPSTARSKRFVCQAFFDPNDQVAYLGLAGVKDQPPSDHSTFLRGIDALGLDLHALARVD